MKKDVTLDELAELLSARIDLSMCSYRLWRIRTTGKGPWNSGHLRYLEGGVKAALDRLWEAQQRAA